MDIHRPKAWHGGRELLKEIAIIVLGVLIALGAEQAVQAFDWANKAGLAVAGFAKIEALLASERALVLIHATDAAADGVAKLNRRFNALAKLGGDPVAAIRELTGAEMSLAMGRPNVIHAAATEGGATRRLIEEARRLQRYRLGQEASGRVPPPVN